MKFSLQLFLFPLLLPLVLCAVFNHELCSEPFSGDNLLIDNFNKVTNEFVTITPYNGHATSTMGVGSSVSYGLSRCQGDIGIQGCSDCISAAIKKIREDCPNTVASRIWYDSCFIRYATNNIFGTLDISDTHVIPTGNKAAYSEDFFSTAWELLSSVRNSTFVDGKKFGTGKKSTASGIKIYGMAQCTSDLQPLACLLCSEVMIKWLKTHCMGQIGCTVESSSCVVRFEAYNFLWAPKIHVY